MKDPIRHALSLVLASPRFDGLLVKLELEPTTMDSARLTFIKESGDPLDVEVSLDDDGIVNISSRDYTGIDDGYHEKLFIDPQDPFAPF